MTQNLPSSQRPHTSAIRAYLGGSFNPVHSGHIEMAMQVYNTLAPLAAEQHCELQVSLLPNARSPFKSKSTAPKHRLAMLKLAIQGKPLRIDELELWQTPPVYTIDSVRELRQRYPYDRLIFIMGMDSARSLEQWKQGLQLTDYTHLWIFQRSDGTEITAETVETAKAQSNAQTHNAPTIVNSAQLIAELPKSLQQQVTFSLDSLLAIPKPSLSAQDSSQPPLKTAVQGHIYIDTRTVTMISSTEIRKQLLKPIIQTKSETTSDFILAVKHNPLLKHLNPAVYHYIIDHQLYSVAQFR